jgi:hypothetical protein
MVLQGRIIAMSLFNLDEHFSLLDLNKDFVERRRSPRHELHYPAHLDLGGESLPMSCIIVDISAGGAKLTVGEHHMPDEFTLVFKRHCRVVRRMDGQVGVKFVQA